jgi:hypothetical protein
VPLNASNSSLTSYFLSSFSIWKGVVAIWAESICVVCLVAFSADFGPLLMFSCLLFDFYMAEGSS